MRFLGRAISGLVLTAVTLALIGGGIWRMYSAYDEASRQAPRNPAERSFIVETDVLKPTTVSPIISAYGEIRAWRTLDVRAAVQGPIVELSENFRDGATVSKGELLFRIDDTDAKRRVADAKLALLQAEFDHAEAKEKILLVEAEGKTAARQVELRKNDYKRKEQLVTQGHATEILMDDAAFALATAEQTLTTKQQALITARKSIQVTKQAVERARITLADFEKELTDTEYHAPFTGQLTDVIATLGRRVAVNEIVGKLIDPAGMEVSFRVLDEEFGRLLSDDGAGRLKALPATVSLKLGERTIKADAVVDRPAAESRLADGGQLIFARLTGKNSGIFRPGDFVNVDVREQPIENIAVLPASAVTTDGRLFLVDSEQRLKETKGRIVRKQGQNWIMADVPFGQSYVRARLPYLSDGIKIQPRRIGEPVKEPARISLDSDRRAKLIAFVENNKRMPPPAKQRILGQLNKEKVPQQLVERLERRLSQRRDRNADGGRDKNQKVAANRLPGQPQSTASRSLIDLSPERRDRLKAFIEANNRMPDEVKQRLIAQLSESKVPKDMVDRLEARMKGSN